MQASPRLRFNREGSLLAVTANDNGIKILANTDGQRLLRMLESRVFEGSRGPPQQINTKVMSHIFFIYFSLLLPFVLGLLGQGLSITSIWFCVSFVIPFSFDLAITDDPVNKYHVFTFVFDAASNDQHPWFCFKCI
jgi:hypothetical protein